MANTGFIQVVGPIEANTDILNDFKQSYPNGIVTHIGIQAERNHQFSVVQKREDDFVTETLTMGRNGILEINNIQIVNFTPLQDEGAKLKINMTFELPKETITENKERTQGKEYRPWLKIYNQIS